MSYTTPPTFSSGDPLAASDLNILGDDITYLKAIADSVAFSGVRVTRSASTNFASGGSAHITWTAEDFDVGSWWSSGATAAVPSSAVPSGFSTIALGIGIRCIWATNGSGLRRATIEVNGSGVAAPTVPGLSGDATELVFSTIEIVSAADTIGVSLFQDSGSTLAVSSMSMYLYRIGGVS